MVEANRKLLILAFTHPHLMHASLAIAHTYDRHRHPPSHPHPSPLEIYHFHQATALFNKRLRQPITPSSKDPIWGTAAALALLTFSSPTCGGTPWPLKPSDDSDFEWLRMSKGKMALWSTVNPLREDSLFAVMAPTYAQMNSPLPEKGIDGISSALAHICGLDASSTPDNNPYFNAAHAVSRLQDLPDSEVTVGHTEVLTRCIQGTFKDLLVGKDPVALLLLYLWYRKAGKGVWWIEARGRVEGPAICEYLRLYYGRWDAVLAFLPGGSLAERQ